MPAAVDAAPVLVEIAVDSLTGAVTAAMAGAGRLELCAGLLEGGLTPSAGLLAAVKASVRVPVFAMVRPRGGDFLYDDAEFDVMCRDVRAAKGGGADGIVTGMLAADGRLDVPRMQQLRELAAPLPVTCHRCIDVAADAAAVLDDLLTLGIQRVLTSGGATSAANGRQQIAALVQRAQGRIAVIAGAGVRADNVAAIVAATGVREVHLSASTFRRSAMTFRRDHVTMGAAALPAEHTVRTTDAEMVARVVAAVRRPSR
jgi:copper homeostasis protein